MPTKKKTASPKKAASAKTKVTKKKASRKAAEPEIEPEVKEVAAPESGILPKIQCFGSRKKIICSHLLLGTRKCTAKMIANGRHATVNVSKKRRCEFYEETAYSA